MQHQVKCWPAFYEAIITGKKTHDLRKATDRHYQVGDTLKLQEYDNKTKTYTGRETEVLITYITGADSPCAYSMEGLDEEYCILSITLVNPYANSGMFGWLSL